jgi:hypothetical protein
MQQLSLWTLLHQINQQNEHQARQSQLPACLVGWELWRIDYAPKGYRLLHREMHIFTELHPTVTAAIAQAVDIGFLTATLPLADLELLFDEFAGVLPARFQYTLRYLECAYPHQFLVQHQ